MKRYDLGEQVKTSQVNNGIEESKVLQIGQQSDSTAAASVATNFNEGSVVGSTILAPHLNLIMFPIYLAVFASDIKTNLETIKKKYSAAESIFQTFKSFDKDFREGKKASLVQNSNEIG